MGYLLVYGGDIVLTGNNSIYLDQFVHKLANCFSIEGLVPLHNFLGVEVINTSTSLFLSQYQHIIDLLVWFNMDGANEVATPLVSFESYSLVDGSRKLRLHLIVALLVLSNI